MLFLDARALEQDLLDVRRDVVFTEENALFLRDRDDELRVLDGRVRCLHFGQVDLETRREERRGHHENDEQHQHHVDERRDVDLA